MTKKKDSFFTEPYHLVKMLWEAVLLVVASVRTGILGASRVSKEKTATQQEAKESYRAMQEDLKTVDTKAAWKRFLLTGLGIQAFLVVITLLHVLSGNFVTFLQLLVLLIGCFVLFGYKPWILRNKMVVSFPQYVKKLPSDPGCLILWNSLNVLD